MMEQRYSRLFAPLCALALLLTACSGGGDAGGNSDDGYYEQPDNPTEPTDPTEPSYKNVSETAQTIKAVSDIFPVLESVITNANKMDSAKEQVVNADNDARKALVA